jgi:very-short-patch-repair endonuclease
MTAARTQLPSPPAGEDAARSAAGEGLGGAVLREGRGSGGPSPAGSLRSPASSPVKGEGKKKKKAPVVRTRAMIAPRTQIPSPVKGEGKKVLVGRARALRSRMTDAERRLWFALRDRRFANFKFRRQVPIGRFIADFICFEARLVIEVDGSQHADSIQDLRRDRWFKANGFRVLRFWNNEVLSNLEGVMTVLADALKVEEWP